MTEEQVQTDDVQARINEALDPIQQELEQIQKQATGDPELPAWETNPNWTASSWDKAMPEVEKALKSKGYTPVDATKIIQQVKEELQKEEQEKAQAEKQVAESLEQEVSSVKEDWKKETEQDFTKEMEQSVYDFASEWNKEHPHSKVSSFKDAVDMMKSMNKLGTKKEEEKPRMSVTPTAPQDTGRKLTFEEAVHAARQELS